MNNTGLRDASTSKNKGHAVTTIIFGFFYEGVSLFAFIEMMQQNSLALTGEMAYSCGVYCRVCPSLFAPADSPGGTL